MKKSITPITQKVLPPGAEALDTIMHKCSFSQEEKDKMTEKVLKDLNKIDRLEEEKKSFVDEKNSEIKNIKLESGSTRKNLELGFELLERECWLFPDQVNKVMNYTDCETNEVLWSRPLHPSERQLFINNNESTGTGK